MAGEKTEKATPKRKSDERKKGNVFQSKEIVTVASMIATFYALKALSPLILTTIKQAIIQFFTMAGTTDSLTTKDLPKLFIDSLKFFAMAALPLLLIGGAISIVATGAQTRFLVSFKTLAPKGNRLNPLQGIKKMFSLRGLIELMKSIIKIIVLGVIIYNELKDKIFTMSRMMSMEPIQVMQAVGDIILSIVQTAAILFAFVAAFDLFYQWWDYEKNLRMSKQEIKEEYKQTEGDPQVKGKIKERQQQQARKRMMQGVPNADVVIRNPTHFAVALKYDSQKHAAPIVIAKGADLIALKIVEIAEQNNITVMENKPLARGLYDTVELNQEIPEKFYQPVAEVLAFVYSLKKKKGLK